MKPSVCYKVMCTLSEYQCCLRCQCPLFVTVTLTEGSAEIHPSVFFDAISWIWMQSHNTAILADFWCWKTKVKMCTGVSNIFSWNTAQFDLTARTGLRFCPIIAPSQSRSSQKESCLLSLVLWQTGRFLKRWNLQSTYARFIACLT